MRFGTHALSNLDLSYTRTSQALQLIEPTSDLFSHAFYEFTTLCRRAKRLPAACFISDLIVLEENLPLHQTALSDVYRGVRNSVRVALKSLRVHGDDKSKVEKASSSVVILSYKRLINAWQRRHSNLR